MKNPESMTTEELVKLADDMKSGITDSWIKRRCAVKHQPKPLLVRQS